MGGMCQRVGFGGELVCGRCGVMGWGDLGGVIQSVYILEPTLDTLPTWLSCVKYTYKPEKEGAQPYFLTRLG